MATCIRTIDIDEAEEAEAILRAAFTPYVRRLGRELTPQSYEWLPAAIGEGRVYGAVEGRALVGVAITSADDRGWTLEQIAVEPSQQGAGIGSTLIRHVETEARRNCVPALFLDTATMMLDLLARYKNHGFHEIRRGPPTHDRDRHERVYMEKRL